FGLQLSLPQAYGSSINWVGGNGDWNDSTYWSTGTVPGEGDDVSLTALMLNETVTVWEDHTINSLTFQQGTLEIKDSVILEV
ncbi:unnamed protein product, partial [Heterosigma akashiwo]